MPLLNIIRMNNSNRSRLPLVVVVTVLNGFVSSCAFGEDTVAFVEPYRDIELSASEMGTLSYIHVKEGARVAQGQVLAGIDESVVAAMLVMAEKAKEARGRLKSAQAELDRAEHHLEKLAQLAERKHATDQEISRAKSERAIAAARREAVVDELAVKSADYDRIKAQLELKRVRSPINGIVSHVYKDVGEFVSANEPAVVRVVQLDPLVATFSLNANEVSELKPNQPVPLLMGSKKKKISGDVDFVSPTIDPQTGTVRVKVLIPNSNLHWQAGERCWFAGAGQEEESTARSLSGRRSRRGSRRSTEVQ